jgi:ribosome-associated toxin RatA of RatAB toxin-antitoxin module
MAETGGLTDVIAAPPDKIIDALLDFESYPEWQGSILECEVLDRDSEGRASRVRMKVDAKIRKVEYVVKYSYDLPDSLSWDQESGDLKDNHGRYTFAAREDGGTDVSVDITFEIGFFVPGPMKNLIRDQSLKNSMRELRKRVEG